MSLSTFRMARPSSSMSCSLNSPSSLPSRDLSTARMCSVRALARAPMEGVDTKSGNRSAIGVVVNGTMTTVPRRWLMSVSDRMAHGRVLACSCPLTGSSWVQYTWPRSYAGVMPCHAARALKRSERLGQARLPVKMFQHRSLGPNHPLIRLNLLPAIGGFRPEVSGFQLQAHSWLHMQPPVPGLLCPVPVEPDQPETGCVAWRAPPLPIYSLCHLAGVAIPV
jgi:hypothetical protein